MFEKKERAGLMVYLHYNRDARKLGQYGDLLYHSRKMRYVVLYVPQDKQIEVVKKLEKEKFVKEVLPSPIKDVDQNFVGNLNRGD